MTTPARTRIPRPIAAALVAQLLGSIGFGVLAPVLPFFVQRLGATPSTVTQLVATYALAGVVFSPLLGRLSDRFGRKIVIVTALAVTAGAYTGLLAAQSLALVFACRAAAGGAAGQFGVLTALVVDAAESGDRTRFVGWLGAMSGIGIALGPLVGALLVQLPVAGLDPLRSVMLGALCLSVVTLAFVVRAVPATAGAQRVVVGPTTDAGSSILRRFASLLWFNFGIFVAFGVMFSTTAIYVERVFGWGPTEAGYAIFAMTGTVAAVRLAIAHRVVQRFTAQRSLPAATFAFAASLSASALARDWRLFLLAYCAAAACYAIAALCVTVMLADQAPPAQRGAVLGWSSSVGSIAIAVSATLSGPLFERFSPGAPFHVGSAAMTLLLLAALAHARLRATGPRPALRRERHAD